MNKEELKSRWLIFSLLIMASLSVTHLILADTRINNQNNNPAWLHLIITIIFITWRIFSKKYLKGVKDICTKHNIILIWDCIQTTFGRIGAWSASGHYGITPDIMVMGKSMGAALKAHCFIRPGVTCRPDMTISSCPVSNSALTASSSVCTNSRPTPRSVAR